MKNQIDTFNNTDPLDDIIFLSDFIYLFSISISVKEEFYGKYKIHSYVVMKLKKKTTQERMSTLIFNLILKTSLSFRTIILILFK